MSKNLVLIHGMGRLRWSMIHLVALAKKLGFKPFLFEYKSKNATIEQHAENLVAFLEKNNIDLTQSIYFIAHSLGSVLTIKACSHEKLKFSKSKAVFLGPPLKGAKIASFATKLPLINRYFGPPLTELTNIKLLIPNNLEAAVIAGVLSYRVSLNPILSEINDTLVTVDETKLDGILQHRIIRCPHAVMMYHPKIIRLAFRFLKTGSFDE